MAYMTAEVKARMPKIIKLAALVPESTFVDIALTGISMQAHTCEQVQATRKLFPPAVWKRTWNKSGGWWFYEATIEGVRLDIYACSEAPPQCKAIMEKRTVTRQVPTAYEEVTEEQEVIVGWDCGGEVDAEDGPQ